MDQNTGNWLSAGGNTYRLSRLSWCNNSSLETVKQSALRANLQD